MKLLPYLKVEIITCMIMFYTMLKDSNRRKPSQIEISEDVRKQMMEFVRDGILRKINAVRHMQTIDKEIAAGLYVYAVEEFGKLLLLRDTQSLNGKRKVKYDKGFLDHCRKFTKAFDDFQKNGLDACKVLALDFEINDAVLNDV